MVDYYQVLCKANRPRKELKVKKCEVKRKISDLWVGKENRSCFVWVLFGCFDEFQSREVTICIVFIKFSVWLLSTIELH